MYVNEHSTVVIMAYCDTFSEAKQDVRKKESHMCVNAYTPCYARYLQVSPVAFLAAE